jgi:hypothetical protein
VVMAAVIVVVVVVAKVDAFGLGLKPSNED